MASTTTPATTSATPANCSKPETRVGAILSLLAASPGDDVLHPDEIWTGLVRFLFIAVAIIVGYVIVYRRYVPRPSATTPEFVREPPADLPPAIVGLFFNTGPSPEKLAATLLDLVRRGIVDMQLVRPPGAAPDDDSRDDRALRLHRERVGELRPFEADFIYELFDHIGGGTDQILRREAEALGLVRASDFTGKKMLMLYAVIPFVAMFVTFPFINIWAFMLFSVGVVMLVAAQAATGLTPHGAEVAARYGAFKRFLDQFARMQEKPAEGVVLWEQYLTLAIVLGLATEAMDDLYVEPPTFGDYGSAGRSGRHGPPPFRNGAFVDAAEALAYAEFRRRYDSTLPDVKISTSRDVPSLQFRPPIDQAFTVTTTVGGRVTEHRVVTGFNGLRGLLFAAGWFILVPAGMVAVCVIIVLATQ
jgi:hypothetical protein